MAGFGAFKKRFRPGTITSIQGLYRADKGVNTQQACQFDNSDATEIQIDDNADFNGDTGFTICAWVNRDDLVDTGGIVSKWGAAGVREYVIQLVVTTGVVTIFVSDDGTGSSSLSATTALTAGSWFFVVVGYDDTNQELFAEINAGTRDTADYTDGVFTGGGEKLRIGFYRPSSSTSDKKMEAFSFWKRPLTTTETAYMYNSGTGRIFSELGVSSTDGSTLTDAKVYLEMNEFSAGSGAVTRQDSTTNNHDGTDINTTASVLGHLNGPSDDGDPVHTWTDQSGQTNDMTIATPAVMPTFQTGQINGAPAVRFDGSDDYMELASTIVSDVPFTVIVVATSTDVTNSATMFFVGDKDVAGVFNVLSAAGSVSGDPVRCFINDASASGSADSTTGYSDGVPFIATQKLITDESREVYIDGGSIGTDTTDVDVGAWDRTALGARRDSTPSNFIDADIAEVIVYNVSLSAINQRRVELYLSRKYGVAI